MDDEAVRRVAAAFRTWADGRDPDVALFYDRGDEFGYAFSLGLDRGEFRKMEWRNSFIVGGVADPDGRWPARINLRIDRMTPTAIEALAVMLQAINEDGT